MLFRSPPGGAFLSEAYLSSGCGGRNSSFITNTVIRLSTTPRRADQLSAVFTENVGPDETIVWGPSTFTGLGAAQCRDVGDRIWDIPIILTHRFFYDPARGNLLLDLIVPEHNFQFEDYNTFPLRNEVVSEPGDAISRVVSADASSQVAETVDTAGLVTWFIFYPYPTLTFRLEPKQLILRWEEIPPQGALLQTTLSLEGAPTWQDYPGATVGEGYWAQAVIPIDETLRAKYFRVIAPAPQLPVQTPLPR